MHYLAVHAAGSAACPTLSSSRNTLARHRCKLNLLRPQLWGFLAKVHIRPRMACHCGQTRPIQTVGTGSEFQGSTL